MVRARLDWVKLLLTRPCRPSSGRDPDHRPDRDTTQGSHSRGESMLQRRQAQIDKASRYQTYRVSGGQCIRRFVRERRVERAPLLSGRPSRQGECHKMATATTATCLRGREKAALGPSSGASEHYPKRPVM
jgi:hypothetical protein